LDDPRPELCLFGIEPELATDPGMRYITATSCHGERRSLRAGGRILATS
jgi:hypothetical protein